MEKQTTIILTSRTIPENFTYEEYVDDCKKTNTEASDRESREYKDWMEQQVQSNMEQDLELLSKINQYKYSPFVVSGPIGNWYGKPEIKDLIQYGLVDIIKKCVSNSSNSWEVSLSDGVLCFKDYSEGSTKEYTIRLLQESFTKEATSCCMKRTQLNEEWFEKIVNPYNLL